MSVSERAVRRPVATLMVFTGVVVLGVTALARLDVDVFPEIDFPSISVVTEYPGVSPEDIETLLTRPVEAAVARVDNVDRIESFSAEGRSRVALRFDWGTDLEIAVNDVRNALERIRDLLPDDARSPVVYKFDISSLPVLEIALEANLPEHGLRRFAEDVVKPYLERTTGVASVDVQGARRREIRVAVDPERLASLGLGPGDVIAGLQQSGLNVPSGLVGAGAENVLMRPMSEFGSLDDIRTAAVARRAGRPIEVRTVATVVDDLEDAVAVQRLNGERGVVLRVQKANGANTVRVAEELRETIATFNEEFSGRATLTTVVDTSIFVRRSIDDTRDSVLFGGALALLVLVLFLRSVKSTLVVAVAIPISILATFFAMQQLGLTLNLITFGGIALGLGMLVDNAIVILENVFRRREAGDDATQAAIRGTGEVASAVVASTMTTLAVFVPVLFLGGFPAVFFGQMALVVSAALLCSLAVALTLVPVASSVLLRGRVGGAFSSEGPGVFGWVERQYARGVRFAIRRWWLVLAVAAGSFAGAWLAMGGIGQEVLPETDESELRISARFPPGTRIEHTEAAVARLEALIREHTPESVDVLSTVGTPGFWSTQGEEAAWLRVNLVGPNERMRSSAEVANALTPILRAEFPDMRIFARAGGGLWLFNFIRGGDDRIAVQIRGYDLEESDRVAADITAALESIPGVSDVRPSRELGGRELRLYADRERIQDVGLSVRQVAEAVSALTQGTRAAVFRDGGDEIEVKVRLSEEALESRQRVLDAPLVALGGRALRVRDLTRVAHGHTPHAIERLDQERLVTVAGGVDGTRDLASVNRDIRDAVAQVPRPDDFSVRLGGEAAEQDKSFGALAGGFVLALLLVYMVMAGQFESFLHPLVVMFAVPLAAIGVVATMRATDTTLNLNSALGIIVLVGVVVNNAIVLVDYTNLARRQLAAGPDAPPAFGPRAVAALDAVVVDAATRRLRPILMTTATTVLALLPVAFGGGAGSEAQAPLARVVVGGLLSSTLITLFFVPTLYRGGERARLALRAWRAPKPARSAPTPERRGERAPDAAAGAS